MKILYLVRHAKSRWENHAEKDFDRSLNERGKKNAEFMAKVIFEKGITIDKIISSPAKRALTTAKVFANKLQIKEKEIQFEENIYEASRKMLLDTIHQLDDEISSVMMFGHNPGLTLLANYFGATEIDNLPTCGIVGFAFEVNHWQEVDKGKLLFFEYPKKHGKEE